MRTYLQRIATGPEMSKPLSRAAAEDGMRLIIEGRVDPVQAGIYLIALRMKRETDDENLGALDALLGAVDGHEVACDTLVDIADPFNGYARGVPATPFLAPLLAACGLNAYSHGLRAVGPKYGVTHHQVYAAAGVPVDLSAAAAGGRIEDDKIGWAYLDQSRYCPRLHGLVELRAQMVKRCCITTLEVLLGPLRASGGLTHLMTGYVHKAYPPVYSLLARQAGYDGAMIVRGVEGGCIPSLSQPAKFFHYRGGEANGGANDRETRITPEQAGITCATRMIPIPPEMLRETPVASEAGASTAEAGLVSPLDTRRTAAHCVELGLQALAGEGGAMRDSLIYGGAICLLHCGRAPDLGRAAAEVRAALDSGAAMKRFAAARR